MVHARHAPHPSFAGPRRIAEVAGVSISCLYQYFPDKTSLAGALVERTSARDLEELGTALGATAPAGLEQTLRVVTKTMVGLHRGRRRWWKVDQSPELLDDPRFADEQFELAWRYLTPRE